MAFDNIIAARKHLDTLAVLLVVVGVFFISIKPEIVNILFPIATVCTVLAGDWQNKWRVVEENKVVVWGCALLFLFMVGMVYSYVPWRESLSGFGKYTKLIYLLFLTPLFIYPKWRKFALYALLLGVWVNAVVSVLNVWHLPVFGKIAVLSGGYFIHPIYTAALTAFSLFVLANLFMDERKYRWIYFSLILFFCYVLFFVYIQRTGYLIFFVLMFLFFWQRWRWRGLVMVFLLTSVLFVLFYRFSPVFEDRIVQGVSDLVKYQRQEQRGTSWGSRLEFAKHSLRMIRQRPIFGSGTGSFPTMYKSNGGDVLNNGPTLGHPHNEYILIAFQLGMVGLLLFLWWIVVQWRDSFKLPLCEQRLVQGLILAFIVTSLCNVSLYVNATGMVHIIFLSVFFASGFFRSNDLNVL